MLLRITLASLIIACVTAASAESVKTSKERLSDKASDEQRIDNCRVAPDRRGAVARPDCESAPTIATPTQRPASTGQAGR
jgi:hypothetical protein